MVPSVLCGRAVAMVVRHDKRGKGMAMQWDSAKSALDMVELAVKGIEATEATLEALQEAKKRIDEQIRLVREIRLGHVACRNQGMEAALNGQASPDVVAAKARLKKTTMYAAIAYGKDKKRPTKR